MNYCSDGPIGSRKREAADAYSGSWSVALQIREPQLAWRSYTRPWSPTSALTTLRSLCRRSARAGEGARPSDIRVSKPSCSPCFAPAASPGLRRHGMVPHAFQTVKPAISLMVTSLILSVAVGACSRAKVESTQAMNEGVQLAQQGQYGAAVEALERASSLDPTNDQVLWNLAVVHMETHKYERARDVLQKAIAANGDVGTYHDRLGTVLIELEDWAGAKAALEKAVSLDSTLSKAHYKLGQVSERTDDEQSALQQYTEAIRRGPRLVEAYTALSRLYADLGYMDQAEQVGQEALKVVQEGSDQAAEVQYMLGTVYQQKKQLPQAVAAYEKALKIVPGMKNALFSLGMASASMGENTKAKQYLERYVQVAGRGAPQHYVQAAQTRLMELSEEM